MKIAIRDMARGDLERAGEILYSAFNSGAARYGYAPRMQNEREGTSWAWALLRHAPAEIVVAEADGAVAGLCCLNPRGGHGGVGPVAVDPAFQGRGIGHEMMTALMKRAEGLRSVRLYQEAFNPASFSLYYSLGFAPVAELLDMTAEGAARKRGETCNWVREMIPGDAEEIAAYDAPRSRSDRRPDLAYYLKWGKVFVHRSPNGLRGYLACLPGSASMQLGPLVAEGEEEAACLYGHALRAFEDRTCQTRIMARDYMLANALSGLGFRLYCLDLLMVKGAWRPGPCVEAFGRFPEGI